MTRLLLALAHLLSPSLRDEMGAELDEALARSWRTETRGRGLAARARIAVALLWDLIKQIFGSRWGKAPVTRAARLQSPQDRTRMRSFLSDLSFGFRTMVRAPLASVVTIGTLALGVAGAATVFTLVNAELIHPLPYRQADRLVTLAVWRDGGPRNVSSPNLRDIRARAVGFTEITGFDDRKVFNVTGGDEPVRLYGAAADAAFFATLGVEPLYGRFFGAADDVPGADLVAVVGETVWRDMFAADPDLVGRVLRLNDLPYTVIGVAPSSLKIPNREQLWVPLATHPYGDGRADQRDQGYLEVIARLRGGVTLAEARAELDVVGQGLAEAYPDANEGTQIRLQPLREALVGDNRTLLALLMAGVVVVLLITCVNVAALQFTRASTRRGELAVRQALGATRSRLSRQLLTEALLASFVAGPAAIGIAIWSRQLILAAFPGRFPRLEHVGVDGTVLAFVAVVTAVGTLLFGLLPMMVMSSPRALRSAGNGAAGARLRAALVVAEVALALALLINAGLLARTMRNLTEVDSGFAVDGLLTASISLPESRYDGDAVAAFLDQLLERLTALGSIETAGAVSRLPFSGGTSILAFHIDGREPDYEARSHVRKVSSDYFDTLQIPLLAGRGFTADDVQTREPIVIIDATFAEWHWPDGDAVGALVQPGSGAPWFQVVGIVGATRHWGPRYDPEPTIYTPYSVAPEATMMLALRSSQDVLRVADDLRGAVWSLDPTIPIEQVRSMESVVTAVLADSRSSAAVIGIFSGFAMLLAVLGVYGVLGHTVAQRTREVGIRMAVGADRGRIHRLILGQGLRIATIGVLVGLGLGAAASQALKSQLYGVQPFDPPTFLLLAGLLLLAAAAAATVPARRATRIDPVRSLSAD